MLDYLGAKPASNASPVYGISLVAEPSHASYQPEFYDVGEDDGWDEYDRPRTQQE